MKLSFGLFVAAVSAMSVNALKANSEAGKDLMSKARRLEQDEDEDQMQWIADYSLKFQGCHHVYQWNQDVDEEEDVRLYAKRLARFRLCPSDECSTSSSGGCQSGYGDYVVDMATYVNSYYESFQQQLEEECNQYKENYCGCDDNDDEEGCLYTCYAEAEMEQCEEFIEDEEDGGDEFDVEEYLECAEWEAPDNDDERKRRRLEEEEEEEVQYFIGPYCSGQGGSVHMGLFTDDTCTTFADDEGGADTFESLAGYSLPFSGKSIVGEECFSCLEPNYDEEDEDEDDEEEVEINEACQVAYMSAGKCEYNLAGTISNPETSACNYIDGIKIIREDGMVLIKPEHPNAVATGFVVVFAMGFASMGLYVWYLRTRLGIKSDSFL